MSEPTQQEVMEAVSALRSEVEKSAPNQEVIDKTNAFLDAQEEINQKHVADLKASEKREDELKERMESIELELVRGGSNQEKSYKDSVEYKALATMVIKGIDHASTEEKALLRTDNDTAGGYLVVGEVDNVMIKSITEISNIRSIARVRTINAKSLEMPKRTAILSASFEGEAESDSDSTSTYGSETVTPFRQSVTVPVTKDMLMNGSFNMESEIFSDAAEAFAQSEGNFHVSGDGVKKPEGFIVNADILAGARTSGTSGTIDADDIILVTGDLKVGYNPNYVMNRSTLAFLRTLKSADGVFLWGMGMNGSVANTLNGFNYILANDMPSIASNSISIAFGDFQRGYTITDRTGVSIIRDEFAQKRKAIVEFTINRWTTAQVTLAEAITVIKTKA